MNAAVKESSGRLISMETCCDLIDESTIMERLDTGSALIYKANHPKLGDIFLVNASSGESALMFF